MRELLPASIERRDPDARPCSNASSSSWDPLGPRLKGGSRRPRRARVLVVGVIVPIPLSARELIRPVAAQGIIPVSKGGPAVAVFVRAPRLRAAAVVPRVKRASTIRPVIVCACMRKWRGAGVEVLSASVDKAFLRAFRSTYHPESNRSQSTRRSSRLRHHSSPPTHLAADAARACRTSQFHLLQLHLHAALDGEAIIRSRARFLAGSTGRVGFAVNSGPRAQVPLDVAEPNAEGSLV